MTAASIELNIGRTTTDEATQTLNNSGAYNASGNNVGKSNDEIALNQMLQRLEAERQAGKDLGMGKAAWAGVKTGAKIGAAVGVTAGVIILAAYAGQAVANRIFGVPSAA